MTEEVSTTPTTPKKKVGGGAAKAKSSKVKVRFFNQEGVVGGTDDIFVGVNGRGYQIKREEEVELLEEVLHAVENAVITKTERDENGNEIERNIPRFSYTRV